MVFPQTQAFDSMWTLIDDFSDAWIVSPDVGTILGEVTTDFVKVGNASNRMTIGDGTATTDQGDLNKTFTLDMDGGNGAPRSILLRAYGETGQINPAGGSFTLDTSELSSGSYKIEIVENKITSTNAFAKLYNIDYIEV